MKILIIGAVAAGTSAAAKARRNDENAEIKIYEMDKNISYSGCGLPYFIGDEVEKIQELTPRDPTFFKSKYNVDIFIQHEVLKIDIANKSLSIKNLNTNEVFSDSYDKLIISTGATVFKPKIDGIEKEHVFFLRSVQDALRIKRYIKDNLPKKAVIAGTGFIGLELLENLTNEGIDVSIVELSNQLTPNLDVDMSIYLENELSKRNISVLKSTSITSIEKETLCLSNGNQLDADMVIMATGVRPNVKLAKDANIELGSTGAIKVNEYMQTSMKDIYACGDCIETYSQITKKPVYHPLGSTANKTGRIAGENITGGTLAYKGNLQTGIFKLFDLTIASTGLSEKKAIQEGYDIQICHNIKPNKPSYMGGKEMLIKAIADKHTQQLLGVQIIGNEGVDKRIDVFATLLTYHAKVEELFHLDLAYAPPFSTTKDPVHYTGMILDNALNSTRKLITFDEIEEIHDDVQIIDARSASDYANKGIVKNAINIPHASLREKLDDLSKEKITITYCNKGVTGNAAQNILLANGFKNVLNLSGGQRLYKILKGSKMNESE